MLIQTKNLDENSLAPQQLEWLYCGLDGVLTREVSDVLLDKISRDPAAELNYGFNRALQNIAFSMQARGIRVDEPGRKAAIVKIWADGQSTRKLADVEAHKLVGHGFKWGEKALPPSPHAIIKVFYDELGLRPYKSKTGSRTTDKDALTKLGKRDPQTARLCTLIQELRDLEKQREVLETGLSHDGRIRSMFNVGQAETDRWSSNSDTYGCGTNLQNLDSRIRSVFIPDPGYEFCEVDLEQGESRCVAYLAGDEGYIAAHESGNTHTQAARNWWPELKLPTDNAAAKRQLKETQVPWVVMAGEGEASKSYYDVSKNRQHGFNYGRTARSVAIMEGVRVSVGQAALDAHFGAFPGIPRWHQTEKAMLLSTSVQITPLGYRRQFFGPPRDDHTIKEALANGPQSMSVQILNIGMYRVWRDLDNGSDFMLLQQGHDSFLAQVKIGKRDLYGPLIHAKMRVPVMVHGREMTIPCKIAWGKNWGEMG